MRHAGDGTRWPLVPVDSVRSSRRIADNRSVPWLADVLLLLTGGPLVVMACRAPARRPRFVDGDFVITAPLAFGMVLAALLHLVFAPLPWWPSHLLLAALAPGCWLTMTLLPLVARNRLRARAKQARAGCLLACVATELLGRGSRLHPWAPWLGAVVLAALGTGGTCLLLERPLRRGCRALLRLVGLAPPALTSAERSAADRQRQAWRELAPNLGGSGLFAFARSLAPEVRAQCLARLAAAPDLDRLTAVGLSGPDAADVLAYVCHDYPRSRVALAAATAAMLAARRAQWPEHRDRTGDLESLLTCGIAVLRDGGDLRQALEAWLPLLAGRAEFAELERTLTAALLP